MSTNRNRDSGSKKGEGKGKEHLIKLRDTGDDNEMVAVREEEEKEENSKHDNQ